jgi:hypothetical protein
LGSKEVDYGFLIDIAKLRTRSSSRIRAARGGHVEKASRLASSSSLNKISIRFATNDL